MFYDRAFVELSHYRKETIHSRVKISAATALSCGLSKLCLGLESSATSIKSGGNVTGWTALVRARSDKRRTFKAWAYEQYSTGWTSKGRNNSMDSFSFEALASITECLNSRRAWKNG